MQQKELNELLDEIGSYLYGLLIILSLMAVMLFVHLGFSFFFHN